MQLNKFLMVKWGGLMGTHSWIAPEANIAALCFTQRLPGFWHPYSHDFKRLVYEAAEIGF
jgi:CubicO group peptidase (beta-lactamase class C family)